ncbi:MAG TPA: hypothetical protein VGP47_05535 [Parachlamydiaceae bacterium]|nr:hypothetical protein [Parachlamydiaceae bacterium]
MTVQRVDQGFSSLVQHCDFSKYSSLDLENRIDKKREYYLNKLDSCTNSVKAPKYMFLATVFVITHNNESFHKSPSQHLEKMIEQWDCKVYGNEEIMQKFIRCMQEQ